MINLSGEHQLFLDDFLIEEKANVIRRINQPEKYEHNPVLVPDLDHPWEGSMGYFSVLYDEGEKLFRMWYPTYNPTQSNPVEASPEYFFGSFICYATSKDGLHWDKPELEIQDYDYGFHWAYVHGKVKSYQEWTEKREVAITKKNNILLRPLKSENWDLGAVIFDKDDPDPNRRYKMTFYIHVPGREKNGIGMIFSSDGIHWNYPRDKPVDIKVYAGDRNTATYDAKRKKYVALTRPPRRIAKGPGRRVAMWESGDLENWNEIGEILAADERDPEGTELYSMYPFNYESVYIGFLEMYYVSRGTGETQLTCSRDGVNFQRVGRKPFLTWSPQDISRDVSKGFDSAWIVPAASPPIRVHDKLYMWYRGGKMRHWFYPGGGIDAIGLATLRMDGFVSMDAGEEEGIILTKPLTFIGGELHVNSSSEWRDRQGILKVEILNGDDEPISGFTKQACDGITSDKTDSLVTWRGKSDLSRLAENPIKLKFWLRNTRLYSFWFK